MCYPAPLLVVAASYSSGGREEGERIQSRAPLARVAQLGSVMLEDSMDKNQEWSNVLMLLTRI